VGGKRERGMRGEEGRGDRAPPPNENPAYATGGERHSSGA